MSNFSIEEIVGLADGDVILHNSSDYVLVFKGGSKTSWDLELWEASLDRGFVVANVTNSWLETAFEFEAALSRLLHLCEVSDKYDEILARVESINSKLADEIRQCRREKTCLLLDYYDTGLLDTWTTYLEAGLRDGVLFVRSYKSFDEYGKPFQESADITIRSVGELMPALAHAAEMVSGEDQLHDNIFSVLSELRELAPAWVDEVANSLREDDYWEFQNWPEPVDE